MFRTRSAALGSATVLASLALTVFPVPSAEASSISATASCYVSNVNNSLQVSTTPGVIATATLPSPTPCTSSGIANYGVLQLATSLSGGGIAYSGNTNTQFVINFALSDPSLPANTPITLAIPINYDVTLSVSGGGSGGSANGTDFAMYLDSAVSPFWLYRVASSSDSYGGNICTNPLPTLPACNGRYVGSVTAYLNTVVNGGMQRLWLTAAASANLNSAGGAAVDALHTITLGNILLPNGVAYAYDSSITGNPANFTYATTPPASTPVPEPSAWLLLTGGLGLIWRARRTVRS